MGRTPRRGAGILHRLREDNDPFAVSALQERVLGSLYNRAAARDFLDINVAIVGGHYALERLCQLAEAVDVGFDRLMVAGMLRHVGRFEAADFTGYGVGREGVEVLPLVRTNWQAAEA